MRRSKRIIGSLGLALCLLLSSCMPKDKEYEVLGHITATITERFNFPQTLETLYPESENIIIGTVLSVGMHVQVQVDETLVGTLSPGDVITSYMEGLAPQKGLQYLFFVGGGDVPTLLSDEAGYLEVRDGALCSADGSSTLLTRARTDIENLNSNIFLPPSFLYYRDLYTLVQGSDYIFSGTITNIWDAREESFYVRSGSTLEMISAEATPITVRPAEVYKGNFAGEKTLLLCNLMLENTIVETTLKKADYTAEDLPPLQTGATYLFFLIDSPGGQGSPYCFMTNPFQGYVPLVDDMTMPIPTNAVFSTLQYLEDVAGDIQSILSGDIVQFAR